MLNILKLRRGRVDNDIGGTSLVQSVIVDNDVDGQVDGEVMVKSMVKSMER